MLIIIFSVDPHFYLARPASKSNCRVWVFKELNGIDEQKSSKAKEAITVPFFFIELLMVLAT